MTFWPAEDLAHLAERTFDDPEQGIAELEAAIEASSGPSGSARRR
jgi:hypothetical protein